MTTLVRKPADPTLAGLLRGERSRFEGDWVVRCDSARRGAGGGDEGYFEVHCEREDGHPDEHRVGEFRWLP